VAILEPFFLILVILWLCTGVSCSPFLLARVGLCPFPLHWFWQATFLVACMYDWTTSSP
jgi:hypothetical protein